MSWIGLFAPAGTPPSILARLHAEVTRALATPAAKERFEAIGADIGTGSAQDFAAYSMRSRARLPPPR